MIDRRQQLRDIYGFDFHDDFFRFWEFVNRLRPLEPLHALQELGILLVGPFDILAGRFDHRTPRYSPLLHWRYYFDSPEFFTVLTSNLENAFLHWGYYFDDPPRRSHCVALATTEENACEIAADGEDLFDILRLALEEEHEECEQSRERGEIGDRACERSLAKVATYRDCLFAFGTGERPQVGAAYTDHYAGMVLRQEDVIANTYDGIGIVVPPKSYRRLRRHDEDLWNYLCLTDDAADVVEIGRKALRKGFPGTALKLGKDLWAVGGERHTEYAYELLDAAYDALGREVLRKVLRVHHANRDLPSVDILDNE